MSIEFTIYSKADCHLCEVMISDFSKLINAPEYEVRVVDIDTDPELIDRFGERIPVLIANEMILCEYRLDRDIVKNYLDQKSNNKQS